MAITKYHDMSDHSCKFPLDQAKCDFVVEVGSMVGFREEYTTSDMSVKCYQVVGLPDNANMVEMQEISDISGNWSEWTINPDAPVISVEPWKIGLV